MRKREVKVRVVSRKRSRCLILIAALGLVGLVVRCDWGHESRPSILVVLAESVPTSAIPCEEESEDGFAVLCRESVRFTHAFTPSIMSQAAVASVLTGQYPYEHGLRDNSTHSFLSAKTQTIAELALEKGYHTGFFSGGPPLWRGSGLSQGFELFEDNVSITLNQLYRPVHQSFELFLNWLDHDVKGDPFLSFVYVPDLRFGGITTQTDLGVAREKSYQGQFQEFEESFAWLTSQLDKRKRWNSTLIVVAGLNGLGQSSRYSELVGYDVYLDNIQIALLMKPSQAKRDMGMTWKLDANVSLADIGKTLFEAVDPEDFHHESLTKPSESPFPVISLLSVLKNTAATLDESRSILVESGWPLWRKFSGIRQAIVHNSFLFHYDSRPRLFNTLIDRNQILPLGSDDTSYHNQLEVLSNKISSIGAQPWNPLSRAAYDKLDLALQLWNPNGPDHESLERLRILTTVYPSDQQLNIWRGKWALRQAQWKELKRLGEGLKKPDWVYVAARRLGSESQELPGGCLSLLGTKYNYQNIREALTECPDEITRKLFVWIKTPRAHADFDRNRDSFLREYEQLLLDEAIAQYNYQNGLMWDTTLKELDTLHVADLILELPEMRFFRDSVQRRVSVIH